jgi:hypothetical protein
MAPKINLYSSLVCEDYYSERFHAGLPGPLPGGAFPVIDIGQPNPDCHLPEVYQFDDQAKTRFKPELHNLPSRSIYAEVSFPL